MWGGAGGRGERYDEGGRAQTHHTHAHAMCTWERGTLYAAARGSTGRSTGGKGGSRPHTTLYVHREKGMGGLERTPRYMCTGKRGWGVSNAHHAICAQGKGGVSNAPHTAYAATRGEVHAQFAQLLTPALRLSLVRVLLGQRSRRRGANRIGTGSSRGDDSTRALRAERKRRRRAHASMWTTPRGASRAIARTGKRTN